MEEETVPHATTSGSSPLDEGELKESDDIDLYDVDPVKGSARKEDSVQNKDRDEAEALLRKKLLERQQRKDTSRLRRISDDEEMFAMQPGVQESKKKEASLKVERRRYKEDDEGDRRERDRANRKPIKWDLSREKERERLSTFSKRSLRNESVTDRNSPSSYRRSSPTRRKPDDYKDADRRTERSLKREDDLHRGSHHRHHHRHHHHKSSRHSEDSSLKRSIEESRNTTGSPGRKLEKFVAKSATTITVTESITKHVLVEESEDDKRQLLSTNVVVDSSGSKRHVKMVELPSKDSSFGEDSKILKTRISSQSDASNHSDLRKEKTLKSFNKEKNQSDKKPLEIRHQSKEKEIEEKDVEQTKGEVTKMESNTKAVKKTMPKASSTSNLPKSYEEKAEDIDNMKSVCSSSSSSSSSSRSSSFSESSSRGVISYTKTRISDECKSISSKKILKQDLSDKESGRKRSRKLLDEENSPAKKQKSITPQISAELYTDVSPPSFPTEEMGSPHSIEEKENEGSLTSYKKSRFESSPEMDDEGLSNSDDEFINGADDELDVMDVDDTLNLSDLERKNFEDLTDEDKARLSPDTLQRMENAYQSKLIAQLPIYYPGIEGCRNVNEFESLNRIEEGTFGVVFRALEKKTDEVVALKRLKMENELNGFPITSLREINMLLKCGGHPNIVKLREIVVGSNMDKIYLVMEYVDHDMKALMETMSKKDKSFSIGQVKTLVRQLLSGVEHLHEEYVIHRDLKTSNLLLTRNGILKIGDFGLAREFGDPIKPYTPVVVTLWYRSPELLLEVKEYSTAVDMWSVGCIFAEFLQFKPLFPGKGEIDQLNKIFTDIGTPSEKIWPGYSELPGVKKFVFVDTPFNQLKNKFGKKLNTEAGFELLNRLLAPCPKRRLSAARALESAWFLEDPQPVDPSLFPTWPSKSDALCKDKSRIAHIEPPPTRISSANAAQLKLLEDLKVDVKNVTGDGFSLKFDVAKF